MVRKTGVENRRQKMESIYGAGFWSVCHGYNGDKHQEGIAYTSDSAGAESMADDDDDQILT